MSKLFISEFDDNGTSRWGLFYLDHNGDKKAHSEDWKDVVFDTKEEALARLSAIEEEKAQEDMAPPLTLEEAAKFATDHEWKFASTYAKTAPHEYLVKKRLGEEDRLLYERFVATMKANSVTGYFYGHENKYLILGDHYYWFMGGHDNMAVNLINRTTIDYLEFRDGAYYYKGPDKGDGMSENEKGLSHYRVLDKSGFKRAGMYRHFTEDCKCSVSMTARIDVTDLVEYSRSQGTRFYINFLYILCKVLNSSDDYKMGYLWESDELIVYDKLNPTQYVWREEYGTCTPVYTGYSEDYGTFYKNASADLKYAASTDRYLLDPSAHPNWFDASCVPWVSYDSLNVELPDGYLYFLPIVNWGRYRQEGGRLMMPVTVRLNHAVADGFTVANVFRLLEREMGIFCDPDRES